MKIEINIINKFVQTKMRLKKDFSDSVRFVTFAGLLDLRDLPDLSKLSDLQELSGLLISGFQKNM